VTVLTKTPVVAPEPPIPPYPAAAIQSATATVVSRRIGGLDWRICEGYTRCVEVVPPAAWRDPASLLGAVKVKENDGREVWRIRAEGHDLFVKLYRSESLMARIKRCWRGPASLSEWRAAEYARRHGLPAVEPVACGWDVGRRSAGCVLVTAALAQAVPLNQCWTDAMSLADPAARYRMCLRLIRAVAELIARAHQSGLRHVDLHAGNLLVVDDPEAHAPLIYFVDLHGVRFGRPVSDAAVIRNLAQLNQWFRRHATVTQRLRFLRCYLEAREALEHRTPLARRLGLDVRQVINALDRRARAHARRLYAQRDRRALRTNKYFARLRLGGGWRGHVFLQAKHAVPGSRASTLTFSVEQWRDWLADPLSWVRPGGAWQMIKDSHSGTVCRAALPTDPPLPVVVKRTRARNLARRISLALRASRGLRTWRRGYALIHRDMPTARPLAVLERRRLGLVVDGILITEALPDAHDLDALISVQLARLDSRGQRRAKDLLIEALSGLVRRMNERGLVHRDFKASNIMVQWNDPYAGPPRLSLVDLDGLAVRRRTSDRHVRRALARLNVSLDHCRTVTRTDRVRFLMRFLTGWGRDGADYRALWRDLDRRSRAKRRQYERHKAWKLEHYGRP